MNIAATSHSQCQADAVGMDLPRRLWRNFNASCRSAVAREETISRSTGHRYEVHSVAIVTD